MLHSLIGCHVSHHMHHLCIRTCAICCNSSRSFVPSKGPRIGFYRCQSVIPSTLFAIQPPFQSLNPSNLQTLAALERVKRLSI
jgi:hypothetical protein